MADSLIMQCPRCGESFERGIKHTQIFCSDGCQRRDYARRTRERRRAELQAQIEQCRRCGRPFRHKGKKIYCSMKCTIDAQTEKFAERKRAERSRLRCEKCGRLFAAAKSDQRFCSAKCRNEAQQAERRAARAANPPSVDERSCAWCKASFTVPAWSKQRFCCKEHARKDRYKRLTGSSHRRRAKRFGVAYEQIDRIAVFARDGWKCQICGRGTLRSKLGTHDERAPELDHRIPMSLGGPHTWENVQCSCRACNVKKLGTKPSGQANLFPRCAASSGPLKRPRPQRRNGHAGPARAQPQAGEGALTRP